MKNLNENTLAEQPVIDWLKGLGYDYEFGPDLAPGGSLQERDSFRDVILLPRLRRSLNRLNPHLQGLLDDPINELLRVEHPSLDIANKEIYKLLTEGAKVRIFDKDGEEQYLKARFFDFIIFKTCYYICNKSIRIGFSVIFYNINFRFIHDYS